MLEPSDVSKHYTHGGLTEAIRSGLASLGKSPSSITMDVDLPGKNGGTFC